MQAPNFYDKIYLVCYPTWAGGNFLINCLSLSESSVFRDAILARKQLQGHFDYQQKLQYLKEKLQQSRLARKWQDLDLGSTNLFGIDSMAYLNQFHEVLQHKFNPIVDQLIANEKILFLEVHNLPHLDYYLKFWPCAKLIFFTNYRTFVCNRQPIVPNVDLNQYWNTIKDLTWPDQPPTDEKTFHDLPELIKKELAEPLEFEIQRWFDYSHTEDRLYHACVDSYRTADTVDYYIWDVAKNYCDVNAFLNGFVQLSDQLQIPMADADDLRWYFLEWISTLEYIKKRTNSI